MAHEWPGDAAVRSLADWVRNGKTRRQVAVRYRSAVAKDYVVYDSDYYQLSCARDAANERITAEVAVNA